MRQRRKNKIMILGLLGFLFLMTVGYAAFQTNLKIKGTSKVSSNWEILITSVTEGNKTGDAESVKAPTWDKLTASMEANLYQKGDSIEYNVTVENRGTLDAKLDNISNKIDVSNEAALITFSGYTKGEKLLKGTSQIIKVKIEYNPNFNGVPEVGSTQTSIGFDYVQAEGGTVTQTDDYLLTFDYKTNGGTDGPNESYYSPENENIDLNVTADKEGYEFVGWNTNKDAKEGLTSLNMPSENTILYAIFRKGVNITYTKDSGITSIGKESEICYLYNNDELCEITLPSIGLKEGYSVHWYNDDELIGDAGEKFSVSGDASFIAKAIINSYTITYDYNDPRNYLENVSDDITITGFKNFVNQTFSYPNVKTTSLDISDLAVGDVLEFTADVEYTNLTTSSIEDARMGFIFEGDINHWNHGINGGDYHNISGTGKFKVKTSAVITSGNKENNRFYLHIRFDYYTGGTVKFKNLRAKRIASTMQVKEFDSTLGDLPNLSTSGYTFNGWYTEKTGGLKISSDTKVGDSDITYYGHWTANQYNITYEYVEGKNYSTASNSITLNGFKGTVNQTFQPGQLNISGLSAGDILELSMDVEYTGLTTVSGQKHSFILQGYGNNTFWNPGFQFGFLYLSGTGTVKHKSRITLGSGHLNNDYFNLSFRADYYTGGTIKITNLEIRRVNKNTQSKTFGERLGPLTVPVVSGYTFNGWYTAESGETNIYEATSVPCMDTTYYGRFTKATTYSTRLSDNSITLVGNDLESASVSMDDGNTWVAIDNNLCTFNNLDKNKSYDIMLRNGNKTQTLSLKTANLSKPIFEEDNRVVKIIYPEGCGSNLTCTYIKDGAKPVIVNGNMEIIKFMASGNVVARVSDGINSVSSSYLVI